MRDTPERLRDIRKAINQITTYTNQGREAFDRSELIQDGVIRRLEIIGEVVRTLPQDLKDQHQEIPWAKINRMRNILIDTYFVTIQVIWTPCQRGKKAVQ